MTKRISVKGMGLFALAFLAFVALVLISALALAVYAAFFVDFGALSRVLQAVVVVGVFIVVLVLQGRGAANQMLSLGLDFLEKSALADPKHRRVDDEQSEERDADP